MQVRKSYKCQITKNFNSSWHYKVSIIILIFFILPIGNFIKFPTRSISNIHLVEVGRPEALDIVVKKEDTQNISEVQDMEEGNHIYSANIEHIKLARSI